VCARGGARRTQEGPAVANAIHKSEPGDTLSGIAEQYYAVRRPDGAIRKIELAKVVSAIRRATAKTVNSSLSGEEALPAGTTLAIPTLRELNRALFADNSALTAELEKRGFDHARKLLRSTPDQIIALLQPLPDGIDDQQIRRAWTLTALFNLDAVDQYTARYLYDVAGIRSIDDLAHQSPATIDSILQTLTSPQFGRPPELATQGHAQRWIISARIQTRKRIGELTKIRHRFFSFPFDPSVSRSRAEFYEGSTANEAFTSDDSLLAARLGDVYRFQAALVAGNTALRSGNWSEATARYQEARRRWHRIAEATGAVAHVDDDAGLNLARCIETARRLLLLLPSDEDPPLQAPPIQLRRGGTTAPWMVRGFRYSELNDGSKQQVRSALGKTPVHGLPRRTRAAIYQALLRKTRSELAQMDMRFLEGLLPGSGTALARDLAEQDLQILRRNMGAIDAHALYGANGQAGVLDEAGDSLPLSDVAEYLPDSWKTPSPAGTTRASWLQDAAAAQYPDSFLNRADVTPATRFVVMPGESTDAQPRFVPLSSGFASDYEQQILKPRLTSRSSEDLLMDDDVWTSAGAFVTAAPYFYAAQIPMGLRRAYGKLNQPALARRFGGLRVNAYRSDGSLARDVSSLDPADAAAFDPDLVACSTAYTGTTSVNSLWDLYNYAESTLATADYSYRHDDRETARATYADVRCAIETVFPNFAPEAGLAMTAVLITIQAVNTGKFAGAPANRNLRNLTTLDVVVVQNDIPHRVMEGTFLPIRTGAADRDRSASAIDQLSSYFDFHVLVQRDPETGATSAADTDIPDVDPDADTSGNPVVLGGSQVYVDQGDISEAQMYELYLYCVGKIQAIDSGLNWYGYPDDFVPAWSFDLLYGVARDLANRALEAEQRVFSLLQLYQTALQQEFLATSSEELTATQKAVADARVEQQIASNALATAQADESEQQAEAQANKSGVLASVAMAGTTILVGISAGLTAGTDIPVVLAAAAAGASPLAGFIGTVTGHTQDVKVLEQAQAVTAATQAANDAALNVAIEERDVAALQTEQASEYVSFLLSQTLNSDAYLYLLGLAKSVLETYIYHANRMAWLAQRALENETRQEYALVALDYSTQDDLTDMTRAEQITESLESLRSEYIAGQTQRLQEVKWTIALSELDPIAWKDLRDNGTCTFVLRQRVIDTYFPGLYQHRLEDIRVEIEGLVPPDGARGILINPGVSSVRVPNEQQFLAGQIEDDWTTVSLAGSKTFPAYDQYVMKRVLTYLVTLTLSQFDPRSDRPVLTAPQGMLTPVQHLGLDSAWTLRLQRQSNNFDFASIVDVTFTFWFLCAYDSGLEQAQVNALIEDGTKGLLVGVARAAFSIQQPDAWSGFVSDPSDGERMDLRYLVLDVGDLPLWERNRRLTNLLFACARTAAQTSEITLRVSCDYDPAGILITTVGGAAYSLIDIDTSGEVPPPAPNTQLEDWIRRTFYFQFDLPDTGPTLPGPTSPDPNVPEPTRPWVPFRSPEIRWVIKAAAAQAGEAWQKQDENGRLVTTGSGPLQGWGGGSAQYDSGSDWTDIALTVKVAHHGGSARICVRDDGANYYALQLNSTGVALLRVSDGVETQLGGVDAAFPDEELVLMELRVTGDALSASIDQVTVFDGVNGAPASGELGKGSIALRVASSGSQAAAFDDATVVRLTAKGLDAETLLDEPFSGQLPGGWTFANGTDEWNIATEGLPLLDLSQLLNVVLALDYRYEMNLS
jgi:hypothetical protein